jgi:type IV pilus assembly protein PilM
MATSNACWGIEIGAGAIKAVKVVLEGDEPKVAEFAYIPHARVLSTPDIDQDDAKRVALGRLVSEYDLSGATIAVSVPGHSAFARFAKLPPVEPKKVPDIVKFEAVQQIPFPLDEVEWDYQTFVSPDSPDIEVGIFAITKARVASELTILHDVNLTPDVITLSPVAAYNAIAHDLQFTETSPGTILLDVGTTSTDLIIADAGRVWVRTFPIGGHEFTNALVEAFKLSYPKAEKLKREAEQSQHARHVFQALRPVFADLVQDVQRSIGYYQSMHRDAKLERLVGMGSTFQLPGLRKYLKQQLGMNVYRIEQFKRLQIDGLRAAEFQAHTLNFVTAYGLALQGLGMAALQANLMPMDVTKKAMWARKGRWFAAAAGLSLAASGAMFIRPMIDSQATNVPEPKEVQDAVTLASRLTSEAREAGVTEDVGQGARIAQLMSLYEGREVLLRLLGDVNDLLTSADTQAHEGAGFQLQSMRTDYLYGAMAVPTGGGGDQRVLRGRPSPSYGEESYGPEGSSGRFRGEAFDERAQFSSSGGDEEVEAAEGTDGPRVAVTLELSTTQPLVEVFVESSVKRWLQQNAEREGLPYFYNISEFNWTRLAEKKHEAKAEPTDRPRGASGRAQQGVTRTRGGARGLEMGEGDFTEDTGGEIGNERIRSGGGAAGAQRVAQDASQALNQLDQIAPIAPADEEGFAPGTIETFIRVTFVAVLGEPAAGNEGGDE